MFQSEASRAASNFQTCAGCRVSEDQKVQAAGGSRSLCHPTSFHHWCVPNAGPPQMTGALLFVLHCFCTPPCFKLERTSGYTKLGSFGSLLESLQCLQSQSPSWPAFRPLCVSIGLPVLKSSQPGQVRQASLLPPIEQDGPCKTIFL